MEVLKLKGIITKEDVAKINDIMPKVVEISTTKGQAPYLIASINSKIKIRIKDELDKIGTGTVTTRKKEKQKDYFEEEIVYSPEELSEIIVNFKEIEKGIEPSFSDLDASLYTYMELIKRMTPISINEVSKEDNVIDNNTLLALQKQRAFPMGFARIYQEAMKRLGIPCKIITGENGYAWNEIEIGGTYYPLDLTADAEYFRSKEAEGKIGVCKFLTDKEFYFDPIHKTSEYSEEELKKIRALDESEIGKSLEKIEYVRRKEISRPELKVSSKTLANIVKGGVVTPETISEIDTLKISVTKEEVKAVAADLLEIGKYYPEVLDTVELENTSGEAVDMQSVVDSIYESRKEAKSLGIELAPIEITISSSNAKDFDLDFSDVPESIETNNAPIDKERKSRIVLKNTSSRPLNISVLNDKISSNLEELEVSGFDLNGLDLTTTRLTGIKITGDTTINTDGLVGLENISNISVEALDPVAFSGVLARVTSSTSDVHDLSIRNINLHNRKILEELSVNTRLAGISIDRCQVNDIDGLENFSDRLARLNLSYNNLGADDIERVIRFVNSTETNRLIDPALNGNSDISTLISSHSEISDITFNYIRNYMKLSENKNVVNKGQTFHWLLAGRWDIPYYISDAELMAGVIKNTKSPIMLEQDDDIDTVNFNESYLQNTTLLLTIPQIERLIHSGKTIPQDIRIKIQDVTELTVDRARSLVQEMSAHGMNLNGVQIFDKHSANTGTNIAPYTMAQYVYVRETLDNVVAGIDVSEADIDKFATIYDRLGSKITYDTLAIKSDDFDKMMYHTRKRDSSRNLLAGLEEETCVCAGYADILRNALLMVGIDARYNTGLCEAGDDDSGHAWNQVQIDDGTGTKKWYYTDLTWDAGKQRYNWTLLGNQNFKSHTYRDSVGSLHGHDITASQNIETCTDEDYDRTLLREAFVRARARNKGYDYMNPGIEIDIPEDPEITAEILDQDRIREEYIRRKNDMYAKFYGDKDYELEYYERNGRYREHEIEVTDGSITYRTVEDYPEKEEDEKFLILDKYKECLERMTRYEAGDTSVYTGTDDEIREAIESDRQYVETRNHTFDQHKNTQKDLATLGKYGERVPYIPRQTGVLKNIVRAVGNVGIFVRNTMSPIYRGIGRYVAKPLHRVFTRGRDASPYRDNMYHRMVARRDYFSEINNSQNPGHPIKNVVKSRVDAIFKSKEGNEAVLRAGAADIKENILSKEREIALVQNLSLRSSRFDAQIKQLEQEIIDKPYASNIDEVRLALQSKINERHKINSLIEKVKNNEIGDAQTDAISDKQHAIASKEVNTMKVTVIKGFAKGLAVKYVGPKIHDWLLERGKVVKPIEVEIEVPETKQRWIEPTYKDEIVPVYEDVIDTSKNMTDIISANEGKSITGFYSVHGGETGANVYNLTGDEKITAIFQAEGTGGFGLSDTVGLKAPVLTNETFGSDLLNANGLLNQDTTLEQLVGALNSGSIDTSSFKDLYVSVGDQYWTKLSDLLGDITTKVQVGEEINKVVDVAGHYESYTEMVKKLVKTTEVVTNPVIEKAVNVGKKVGENMVMVDGILDVAENLRKTTTDVKSNKKNPRRYEFDEEVDDIPKSKKEYRKKAEERER